MVSIPADRTREQADRKRQREHFIWQERIIARTDLKPAVKLVLLRLALFCNVKTGRCDPSYIGLAEGAGVSERTAIRAIAEAEHKGLIAIERGNGRGNRNQFRFLMPPETLTPKSPFPAEKGDMARRERVTGQVRNPDRPRQETLTQLCHPNTKRNMLGTSREEVPQQWERENDLTVASSSSGAATLTVAPAEDEGLEQDTEAAASYAELRSLWARPWCDDERADRRAFERACEEVTPADILEAAKAWVSAADAPRFLPPLVRWLEARGWERPPPRKASRTGVARKGHHRNGRKVDLAKLALMQGGYVEDASGTLVWGGLQ